MRSRLPDIDDLRTWRPANVTPEQLANYWGFHLWTVRRWLRSGELRGLRFQSTWRIRTDDARLFEFKKFTKRIA